MKKLLTILLLCTLFCGCKKESEEEYYTITGIVRDFNDDTPIQGAMIYSKKLVQFPVGGQIVTVDSALSDTNGKASFTYRKNDGVYRLLVPKKNGYLDALINRAISFNTDTDRTEDLFLAKPSFLNLTIHKANSYLPTDIVEIDVKGAYILPDFGAVNLYWVLQIDSANAPDKLYNMQSVYSRPTGYTDYGTTHVYFKTYIIRNGNLISSKEDSVQLIKFGTKIFTLNY